MISIKKFSILLAVLLITSTSFAQYSSAKIDSIVDYAMQQFNVVGVSVGIVKDGKIIHSKGYGLKTLGKKDKVDENTQFCIASNSKAFTTTALTLLVEDGKLSWNDKVRDYIPEFRMYNAYVTENFTILDLLTHRSGLGLGAGDLMIFPDGSDFTITDIAQSFQYQKPVSAFRTKYDYDNLLYLISGEVIAKVSGMTWEEFVDKRILQTLKMDHTSAGISHVKEQNNLATPHATVENKNHIIPQYSQMVNGAAAGIYSGVADMSKWMLMHLNKGDYGDDEKHLFSVNAQNYMWRIHTVKEVNRNPRYNSHFSGYGLGWELTDVKGNMKVSHTGGMPGMLSKVIMIPDLDFGLVILTNTSDGGALLFESVSNEIVDSYLGLDNFEWIDKYAAYFKSMKAEDYKLVNEVWETVKKADSKSINKDNYIGIYKDPWFGEVEISIKDKQLWFRSLRSPKLNGSMSLYKANTFAVKWEYQDMNADAFAIFSLNEEGKAIGIKMKGISPNIDFSFDFQDLDFKRTQKKH